MQQAEGGVTDTLAAAAQGLFAIKTCQSDYSPPHPGWSAANDLLITRVMLMKCLPGLAVLLQPLNHAIEFILQRAGFPFTFPVHNHRGKDRGFPYGQLGDIIRADGIAPQ
jgi:hypothetical protein